MNEKIYSYENPFEKGQNDFFVVNISDTKNVNDLQTQGSEINENMMPIHKENGLVRFEEASQVFVEKSSKQRSQIQFLEIKNQGLKEKKLYDYQHYQKKNQQKPQSLLFPCISNLQDCSELSLSLEEKKRKPSIITPSTRDQTSLTSRNINSKIFQNQNKVQRQKKPHTEKHVRITSQKFIKYFSEEDVQQNEQFEERNPDLFQASQNLFTQLSRQFEYVGDFSLIRKQMVELALGRKLNVMQNTNEFVTVKQTINKDYCQCLIKACLNMEQASGVYQLKNCIYKRNKAKFILVSGNQKMFLLFFRSLLIRLWQINKLKLRSEYIVDFLVNVQKQTPQMKQLKKEYTKLYNQLSGTDDGYGQKMGSVASKLVPKILAKSIKDNFKRLRSPQKRQSVKNQSSLTCQQKLMELNSKVNKKYYELLNRLKQKNTYINGSFQYKLQKQIYFHEFPMWKLWGFHNKNTYELFIKKKQQILSKNSIKKVFQYLQIQEQYSLFLLNNSKKEVNHKVKDQDIKDISDKDFKIKSCDVLAIYDSKMIQNKDRKEQSQDLSQLQVPYKECISCVQNMAQGIMMPQKMFNLLLQFNQHLKSQYSQLYANKPLIKFSSMDEQLPITMFILIMSRFDKQKTEALNLLGKLQWFGRWIEQKEKENPYEYFQSQKEEQISIVKKMIITFQAAFLFIINEWNITQTVNNSNHLRN